MIDVLDENGIKTGQILPRSEVTNVAFGTELLS